MADNPFYVKVYYQISSRFVRELEIIAKARSSTSRQDFPNSPNNPRPIKDAKSFGFGAEDNARGFIGDIKALPYVIEVELFRGEEQIFRQARD